MITETIVHLARSGAVPAVSILCPLDQARPGNQRDALRVEGLRSLALDRLRADYGSGDLGPIIGWIDEAIGRVDLTHPPASVAVYASAEECHVVELPVTVPERVVVGDEFALRDLVAAVQRMERARILVLSQQSARCLDAEGRSLVEVPRREFPMSFARPSWTAAPHADLPIGERERAESIRTTFRTIDRSLQHLQAVDRLPVVVVGTKRDIAYFREISTGGGDIVGAVPGNHSFDDPGALQARVAPVLEAHFEAIREGARARAIEAASRSAIGIDAVWVAARAGRGHELVVEETFRYPARAVGDRLEPAADAPDAVDAVVGEVFRHGGHVTIVASGALADYLHIVLTSRY